MAVLRVDVLHEGSDVCRRIPSLTNQIFSVLSPLDVVCKFVAFVGSQGMWIFSNVKLAFVRFPITEPTLI